MFALIENNENLNNNLAKLKSQKIEPIIAYNISYKNKNQFKEDLQKIIQQKTKIKPQYSAIIIKLIKIDNSTQGFVNTLKLHFNLVIGLGGMNKINRYFVEQTQIDLLMDPQNTLYYNKRDFIHHFNSGMNHILFKAARDNNISLLFTLNFTNNKKTFTKEIARINQNLKFANKYKIQTHINFIIKKGNQIKTKKELNSILSIFDISTSQKQESFHLIRNLIKSNEQDQSSRYISKQIHIE